jgi:predicted DNA-binding ribbon-helix-helix protein
MTASHNGEYPGEYSGEHLDEHPENVARKRSLSVQGKATSIFISDEMWRDFQKLAADQNLTANRLVSIIRARTTGSLGKAIRMYIVNSRVDGRLSDDAKNRDEDRDRGLGQ